MKILVLDNYDSFTYNLVHILRQIAENTVQVARNDEISLEEIANYDKILLSPGPGIPDEAGIMKKLIKTYAAKKSILGVCLGMQGIAEVFNTKIYNMPKVYHGIESEISILKPDDMLFKSLPESLSVGRYHSWAIEPDTLSEDLEITAVDGYGIPMAISHRKFDVKGVQFHPESVMTPYGKQMLMNWLQVENKEILLPQQDSSKYSMMDRIKGHLFC